MKIYHSECAWHETERGSKIGPIKDCNVYGTQDLSVSYFILKVLPFVLQECLHLAHGERVSSLRKFRITLTFKF